jgi:hypothetical protein
VKLLLDENVPAPITSTVKTLLRRSHDVQHVIDLPGWGGGNVEALALVTGLADELDAAIAEAVRACGPGPRLHLGQDQLPARRHPPGRTAALGQR